MKPIKTEFLRTFQSLRLGETKYLTVEYSPKVGKEHFYLVDTKTGKIKDTDDFDEILNINSCNSIILCTETWFYRYNSKPKYYVEITYNHFSQSYTEHIVCSDGNTVQPSKKREVIEKIAPTHLQIIAEHAKLVESLYKQGTSC